MSVLKIECVGHLGKDSVTNTVNGKNVINFTVAHTESFKKQDGAKVEKTTWLSCAYWIDSPLIAQYLKKGTMVYIEGMPEPAIYDKNDGTKGLDFKVRVFNVRLLAQPKNAEAAPAQGGTYSPGATTGTYKPTSEPIDDLPF